MEKKLQSEFEVLAMEIVTSPQDVGMYCLGNKQLCIHFRIKPNWFHRTMMKVCLGWKWIDITKKLKIMKNKKQSSLDYLIEQLFKTRNNSTEVKETNSESIIQQAKAMHREEIKQSYREGRSDQQSKEAFYHRNSEQYYNETFGGEQC